VTAERREWLAAQLASEPARQAAVRIVVGHLPLVPVSVGREAPGERLAAAEEIAALLREGCVSAYVSGHHAAYYPGVWDGLELLAAGGIGARRLLGWDGRPRSTVTVVDVWEAAGELTYTTFDVETLEPLGGQDLPAALPGGVTLSARAYGKSELAANAARPCQAPTLADGLAAPQRARSPGRAPVLARAAAWEAPAAVRSSFSWPPCPPSRRAHCPRMRGSRASRSTSPMKLKAITTIAMAAPGKTLIHQAVVRYDCPSAIIWPHDGVGGWTPRPRNESVASPMIAPPTPIE